MHISGGQGIGREKVTQEGKEWNPGLCKSSSSALTVGPLDR